MKLTLSSRVQNILGWVVLGASLLIFALLLFWPDEDTEPPIFDVQLHYNREAWDYFSPRAIVGTLKKLNIRNAAVSSAPNEGTFRLRDAGALELLPLLSPYRTMEDRSSWFTDEDVIARMRNELDSHSWRGIGELHLLDGQIKGPVVQFVVDEAVRRNLVVLAHSDVAGLKQLFRLKPELRVLWAHAGMTAPPLVIDGMLYQYRNLWVELSHRTDIAHDGEMKPEWRELFLRYPDRFMIGSGTYNNGYWYEYRYIIARTRNWLRTLPPEVAEDIAYRNAERLFSQDTRN
jgi:hypothetical protein